MSTDRPPATYDRRRPKSFRIRTQVHPDITVPAWKDCKDCHRAEPKSLPSRVQEQPFRHVTHVPKPDEKNGDQVAQSCLECHKSTVRWTDSSAELGLVRGEERRAAPESERGLTYDPAACVRCHRGSPPEVVSDEMPDSDLEE